MKLPNQKKNYDAHNERVNKYITAIEQIYEKYNLEAAKLALDLGYSSDAPFKFSDYPETTQRLKDIRTQFSQDINSIIYRGTSDEWMQSNVAQDLLANSVLKSYDYFYDKKKYLRYYRDNSDALKAFQGRKDKGLNLSSKIWNQSKIYSESLESAISCAIEKGSSAITLSKKISQYLIDFPSLQKDYTDKFGKAAHILDCEYKSIRLARTEINMAYRSAEQARWQQMDFVVGYEVKRSKREFACKLCESLVGKYPKDFVFKGWHPSCRCYVIPILKTEEEFWKYDGRSKATTDSVNEVKDVPDNFKSLVIDNRQKIDEAKRNGTLPYFLKDNDNIIKSISIEESVNEVVKRASSVGGQVQSLTESIAYANIGFVTPINYKSSSSIIRKVTTEGITPYDIKDAVRTTIIVPKNNIEDTLNDLSINKSFMRLKRQKPELFMGYSGNIVNIKASNGIIAEIQVNTAEMIYAKETPVTAKIILGENTWNEINKRIGVEGGLGHKYYEEARVLNPITDAEKYNSIVKKSVEYYSHFQ